MGRAAEPHRLRREAALPPDVAAAAAASAALRSSGSFVRGGQLGTEIKGEERAFSVGLRALW